jgi:fatty-acyl-CoA synthase
MVFNFTRALERSADRTPDSVAVICGDQTVSHAELRDQVRVLAAGLRSLGIGPGDIVAMIVPNSVEFLVCALAANGVGAAFLPLNLRLAEAEWAYIIGHSRAKALVIEAEHAAALPRLIGECSSLKVIIGLGNSSGCDYSFEQLTSEHHDDPAPFAAVGEHDVSRLMYTSGTTARPKGVPLTYGNILWKIFDHVLEFGLTRADRTLLAGPMYHVGAYDLPGTGTLYVGGSVVIVSTFDPRRVMNHIERFAVTNVWLAPAMLNAILNLEDLNGYDTGSVRFVTNGGEKMPAALIERFVAAFPNAWLADSFGMTETVSGDTFLDPEHTLEKIGSVGKPVLHLDVRIVDELDHDVPVGVSGELLLRGPKVFGGYLRDQDATRRAFLDGWFRTGDIAHMDADGYLFIDDRKKDIIVSGGENIASPEVERVLYMHPAVLEAAVVGMPDERWGEVPRAVVVLRPNCEATGAQLIAFCAGHLARFKVPKKVDFMDALPRTASGKVLKRELR